MKFTSTCVLLALILDLSIRELKHGMRKFVRFHSSQWHAYLYRWHGIIFLLHTNYYLFVSIFPLFLCVYVSKCMRTRPRPQSIHDFATKRNNFIWVDFISPSDNLISFSKKKNLLWFDSIYAIHVKYTSKHTFI